MTTNEGVEFYRFRRVSCSSDPPDATKFVTMEWQPNRFSLFAPGVPFLLSAGWWVLYQTGVIPKYRLLLMFHNGRLIHRSGVFQRWFRFPFMGQDDLQIGATWTHPAWRNRGIASLGLSALVAAYGEKHTLWYLSHPSNLASQKVALNAGFEKCATGERTKRFGLRLLGSFVMDGSRESTK